MQDVCVDHSVVSDSATPWTVAHLAPLSMAVSRQEYWSGLLGPPPRDLPNPETEPASLVSPALADGFFTTSATKGKSKHEIEVKNTKKLEKIIHVEDRLRKVKNKTKCNQNS